jgi:hypothetical protein
LGEVVVPIFGTRDLVVILSVAFPLFTNAAAFGDTDWDSFIVDDLAAFWAYAVVVSGSGVRVVDESITADTEIVGTVVGSVEGWADVVGTGDRRAGDAVSDEALFAGATIVWCIGWFG